MNNMEEAVSLIRHGAVDFISKDDYFFENLKKALDNVFKVKGLVKEVGHLRKNIKRMRLRIFIILVFILLVVAFYMLV